MAEMTEKVRRRLAQFFSTLRAFALSSCTSASNWCFSKFHSVDVDTFVSTSEVWPNA